MRRVLPSSFVPTHPADLIGGAAKIGKVLAKKAAALRPSKAGSMKVLLYGVPGVGKTAIAHMIAKIIGCEFLLECVNGRSVSVDLVRRWQQAAHLTNPYDGFDVKIVDELDTCPPAAQDLLLTYLDELPRGFAFIGTSNQDINNLVPRLQTRLQHYKVEAPGTSELVSFLRRWKVPAVTANQIAVGSGGNVRAALLDTESYLDVEAAA